MGKHHQNTNRNTTNNTNNKLRNITDDQRIVNNHIKFFLTVNPRLLGVANG